MQTVLIHIFGAALALVHAPADADTREAVYLACDGADVDGWVSWYYERKGSVWCVAFKSDRDRP